MCARAFTLQSLFLIIFRNKKLESQGLMRFKAFLEEDSSAVIAQMVNIRDQMRVIRMKRQLAKEKESLESMKREKREKRGTGINKNTYS